MGAIAGVIFTLGLVALAIKSLVTAVQERRRVKATFLVLILILLLVVCTSGAYLNVDKGIGVDYNH
jgi:choline-glycine betaine transporter